MALHFYQEGTSVSESPKTPFHLTVHPVLSIKMNNKCPGTNSLAACIPLRLYSAAAAILFFKKKTCIQLARNYILIRGIC